MPQRINFVTSDARFAGLVELANDYNAGELAANPAFVALTPEQYLDDVLLESYRKQSRERRKAKAAAKLANATDAQIDQVNALIP